MVSVPRFMFDDVNRVVSDQLSSRQFCFVGGDALTEVLDTNTLEVANFSRCWDELRLDGFMADGGTYRYRRYGQFLKRAKSGISQLPHEPYIQCAGVNSLNGGVLRHFEPLSQEFSDSALLTRLLLFMSEVYDSVEGAAQDWNIRLHPYRIYTNACQIGKPTPEGLHRDGVSYIASMMIKRVNIMGGRTTITDSSKNKIDEIMLQKPLDILLSDDEKTMHEVSGIRPEILGERAYRDVLVIAFTKKI